MEVHRRMRTDRRVMLACPTDIPARRHLPRPCPGTRTTAPASMQYLKMTSKPHTHTNKRKPRPLRDMNLSRSVMKREKMKLVHFQFITAAVGSALFSYANFQPNRMKLMALVVFARIKKMSFTQLNSFSFLGILLGCRPLVPVRRSRVIRRKPITTEEL